MQLFNEGHFKMSQGIVVQPDKGYHKYWYKTSNQRNSIKYFLKSPGVVKYIITHKKSSPDKKEGIIDIRMVRYTRLLRDENSLFLLIVLPWQETLISLNIILRYKVAKSNIKIWVGS